MRMRVFCIHSKKELVSALECKSFLPYKTPVFVQAEENTLSLLNIGDLKADNSM